MCKGSDTAGDSDAEALSSPAAVVRGLVHAVNSGQESAFRRLLPNEEELKEYFGDAAARYSGTIRKMRKKFSRGLPRPEGQSLRVVDVRGCRQRRTLRPGQRSLIKPAEVCEDIRFVISAGPRRESSDIDMLINLGYRWAILDL